ncbi:helix-turn-helix transcriptional regulator [Elongatibacter sediminis]|uniref:AlpA family phage regulatory protein n=1 Tax=Elongatibacter sediminis TaxID=3119006 RepID=A0AAW9RAP3_9GAMM
MKFLSKKQVVEKVGVSIQTIDRWEKEGRFPKRVRLPIGEPPRGKKSRPGYYRVVWIEEEVEDFMHLVALEDRAS